MALRSMTGYGRGESRGKAAEVVCELSSVNRRQLDVRVALPRSLQVLEARVCELVQARVVRGHIVCNLDIRIRCTDHTRSVRVDQGLLDATVAALREAAERAGIDASLGIRDLLQVPELLSVEGAETEHDAVWPTVEDAVREALEALCVMRTREGRNLERDLARRVKALRTRHGRIARRAPRVPERYRRQLLQRLEQAALEIDTQDASLLRELALFADRCDIAEELTRLESHFEQAAVLLAGDKPAGRPLEFLVQEMGREVNTIGAKANDARISALVIECKAELERIREQVQNVE